MTEQDEPPPTFKAIYYEDREYILKHSTGSLCNARPGSGRLACPQCFPEKHTRKEKA